MQKSKILWTSTPNGSIEGTLVTTKSRECYLSMPTRHSNKKSDLIHRKSYRAAFLVEASHLRGNIVTRSCKFLCEDALTMHPLLHSFVTDQCVRGDQSSNWRSRSLRGCGFLCQAPVPSRSLFLPSPTAAQPQQSLQESIS